MGELFLVQFICDLVEHHNQFCISQIHVLNIFLGVGSHRGEVYKSSSAKKQSLQQIASCLYYYFFFLKPQI